jgi:alpha-glucosidase
MLALYRRLLAARRGSEALRLGDWSPLASPRAVLAYERTSGADRRAVAINFTSEPVEWSPPGAMVVEVSTDPAAEGAPPGTALAPDQAVLLRPA